MKLQYPYKNEWYKRMLQDIAYTSCWIMLDIHGHSCTWNQACNATKNAQSFCRRIKTHYFLVDMFLAQPKGHELTSKTWLFVFNIQQSPNYGHKKITSTSVTNQYEWIPRWISVKELFPWSKWCCFSRTWILEGFWNRPRHSLSTLRWKSSEVSFTEISPKPDSLPIPKYARNTQREYLYLQVTLWISRLCGSIDIYTMYLK